MEMTLETAGHTFRARAESMGLAQATAADFNRSPVLKVVVRDAATIAALTPEQVRGKVLVLDFAESNVPVSPQVLRLQPSLVVSMRADPPGTSLNRPSLTCESAADPTSQASSVNSVAWLRLWDADFRAGFRSGKPGPEDATLTVHIPAPKVMQTRIHNVVGVLRGSDAALRDSYVLVTAHYDHLGVQGTGEGDHIYKGANDDASGTASVIEIANALASQPERAKRSIVFITFFGEELGLLGSRYYGTHPIFPLAKTVADLNLEQLGRTDVDGGSSVSVVNVTGYDFSTLTDAVRQAGDATGLKVMKDEQRNVRYFARSDNQALADVGVPAHTLSVGYMFPDQHKVSDEWQKLDYDNMARVARTVALAVFRVADSPETPQWKKDIPDTERYIKARQDSLGKP
jgi:hypothetical protein